MVPALTPNGTRDTVKDSGSSMGLKRVELRQFIADHSLIRGPIVLSSGERSNYYFDCKITTLDPDGALLVADEFLFEIAKFPRWPDAIGGLTLGANPIVGAVMMRARDHNRRLPSFYVRKEPKEHGTKRHIENPPKPGSQVVIVDDVVTKGGSVIQAIDQVEATGCHVLAVICLLDRLAGGTEKIRRRCSSYVSLYTREDFPELQDLESSQWQATGNSATPSNKRSA
jgi:orotate phosphoribosyltransferase